MSKPDDLEIVSNFLVIPKLIDEDFSENLHEILTNYNRQRKLGEFFSNYVSPYKIKLDVYKSFYEDLLQKNNQFSVSDQLLFWYPEYIKRCNESMYLLMEDHNYIQIQWKYYIAIMAVSALKCEYLLRILEEKFLQTGGDINWLINGLKVVPEKLQVIAKLNNILAHQPWKISSFDFNNLFKCDPKSSQWNLDEIMIAFLIIIKFQKMAVIFNSTGIKIKMEMPIDISKIIVGIFLFYNIRS